MLPWILGVMLIVEILGCGSPGSPSHSSVTFNTDSVQIGTVATYKCESGFDLLGPTRRLCAENDTWIPPGIPVCVMNVASGKAPMQSSIASKGVPQKAVDGSTSRVFSADTCTLTETESTPWWYVNLLEPFIVQLVRVDFGRPCCPNSRPASVVVRVGNNRPDLGANPICNRFTGKIDTGRPLFFPCTSTVSGAFISIHLESSTPVPLSICEAFVYTDQVLPVEQCPTLSVESSSTAATYNGKCYVFHSNQPRTLESARRFCEVQGGSLVHETSPALQGFLSWELYKRHRKEPSVDYWNGALRDPNSNTWKWINDQEVTISFWSVPTTDKNCSRFDGSRGWLWSDTECDKELNYICQHQPTSCGKPERPVNSTTLFRNNDIGSTVDYQCSAGHLLVGPTTRTCLSSGFYSDFPPKCNYLECGFPANIPNGGYTLVNGTRHYLSTVEYFCQDGYVMVGRQTLICETDQKWNGPPPRCDALLCHNPPAIANGNVSLSVNSSIYGTSAEYTCDVGYNLVGKETISCESTGYWDPQPPTCEIDKSKLVTARPLDSNRKRSRASIAARLNMGGIIALGIFGGFVFLAVIISIVVIIVRRTSHSRDSLDSLSTYESGGSRERLYQHRQCWPGHPTNLHPGVSHQDDFEPPNARRKGRSPTEGVREPLSQGQHHSHHHHQHHHQSTHRDSDASLDTSSSANRWCPKHDRHSGY